MPPPPPAHDKLQRNILKETEYLLNVLTSVKVIELALLGVESLNQVKG